MEISEEDYDAVLTLRIPISLAKAVNSLDWGISRKKRGFKSKPFIAAIQEGVAYKKLQNLAKEDPEKLSEIQEKFKSMLLGKNKEEILETMDLKELDGIIEIAALIQSKKASQLVLDV